MVVTAQTCWVKCPKPVFHELVLIVSEVGTINAEIARDAGGPQIGAGESEGDGILLRDHPDVPGAVDVAPRILAAQAKSFRP